MEGEHYVALFSNSSDEFYNNTITSFTNNLSPPLVLEPLGKWKVGITEIRHNYIQENSFVDGGDEITYGDKLSTRTPDHLFRLLNYYTLIYAKTPLMYNSGYFHDFLDVEKLKEFPNHECFEDLRTTIDTNLPKFYVKIAFEDFPEFDNKILL